MIRTRHHGELLVGAAEIVETGDEAFPYIIAAPTMRVPHVLRIHGQSLSRGARSPVDDQARDHQRRPVRRRAGVVAGAIRRVSRIRHRRREGRPQHVRASGATGHRRCDGPTVTSQPPGTTPPGDINRCILTSWAKSTCKLFYSNMFGTLTLCGTFRLIHSAW